MGQTGRRSIATHILAVKIALAAAHFHGFGVARQGPWVTWVNKSRNRRGLAASQFATTANKRLYFVPERQQLLKRWVEPLPAPPAEAGSGRFVGLGREPVPRRPPSRIHGVRATRHHEVGIEALHLLTHLGKSAGRYIRLRTERTNGSFQHVAVSAVALFVADQD